LPETRAVFIIAPSKLLTIPPKTDIAEAIQTTKELKMSGSSTGQLYGRMDLDGNVTLEDANGSIVTSIDADVTPIDSDLSAREEHPDGITLSRPDAAKLGVILEGM